MNPHNGHFVDSLGTSIEGPLSFEELFLSPSSAAADVAIAVIIATAAAGGSRFGKPAHHLIGGRIRRRSRGGSDRRCRIRGAAGFGGAAGEFHCRCD